MSDLLLTRSLGTRIERPCEPPHGLHAQFDLLVASGGGAGSPLHPAPHEIWFSSTNAIAPSPFARTAGMMALARLMEPEEAPGLNLSRWFEGLRAHIAASFGAPDTVVLLAPGVAAARDLARAIAWSIHGKASWELSAGAAESQEMALEEAAVDIALRFSDGSPRDAHLISQAALQAARVMGGPLLIHLLDQSRSGLCGLGRDCAQAIADKHTALTLVDASMMRAPPERLRADLAAGRMVLISGSTFLGGHGSSAALLISAKLMTRLRHAAPETLLLNVACSDMETRWRERLCGPGAPRLNIGLGLRWSAALAELDRYLRVHEAMRAAVLALFVRKVRSRLSRCDLIDAIDEETGSGVTPLILHDVSLEEAERLRAALAASRDTPGDAACHLGAAMTMGDQIVGLPIAASAPMVSDVADRIAKGVTFERAFAPIQRDIDTLFAKLERVRG